MAAGAPTSILLAGARADLLVAYVLSVEDLR